MSQRRLLASLQAPFLKDKKGVRFSTLYLQKKRNLLVLDHSHQQVSYFSMLVQLLSGSTLEREKHSLRSTEVAEESYLATIQNTLTHDAKTGRSLLHDNIVPKPDLALELGKSISLTEAEEEAVAREVHATHARIKRSSDSSKKLKGIQTLNSALNKKSADIMKASQEIARISKRQPRTGGSNEGTGNILGVPDESTVVSRASSEGTRSKPGVPDEEKLILGVLTDETRKTTMETEVESWSLFPIHQVSHLSFTDTSSYDLSISKLVSPYLSRIIHTTFTTNIRSPTASSSVLKMDPDSIHAPDHNIQDLSASEMTSDANLFRTFMPVDKRYVC
ncbi:hypothetical protein Tco_0199007 [Tanacetum coccineum]